MPARVDRGTGVVSPRGGGGPEAAAQRQQQRRGDREGQAVEADHELRAGEQQHRGRARRAEDLPDVAHHAVERVGRGQVLVGHERRQQRRRRGAEERVAEPGRQRERHHRRDPVGEDQRRERRGAQEVRDDRAAEPAGAVDHAADQRAEEHGRQQVGEQHRRRRPRGADALIGEQHQRDVAGGGAQASLQVGGEEPARAPLLPPQGQDATHAGGVLLTAAPGHVRPPFAQWVTMGGRHTCAGSPSVGPSP